MSARARRSKVGVGSAILAATLALASRSSLSAPRRPSPAPASPLPAPPTLPLVRVEVARDHVLVVEDVLLRRGDWSGGDLELYVAFGAPGVPRALDARLYAGADDDDGVAQGEPYSAVAAERAFRRPAQARSLLGPPSMAGAILHIQESSFRWALGPTGVTRLRVRTLLAPPVPDAGGGAEVLVRLGAHLGEPDALGAIEVSSVDPRLRVIRARARLCGPEADPRPLAVHVPLVPGAPRAEDLEPVAPVASVRHASDDLCVRYWTTAGS